jgi:phosphohistidine phosphatase
MMRAAMRQLLLLRHAKSAWDDPALADHARPLNGRGRAAARLMAAEMQHLGLTPDLVLVSSARRTLQTLEALKPLEGSPIITISTSLSVSLMTTDGATRLGVEREAEREAPPEGA